MPLAVLAIGSNIGDGAAHFAAALDQLRQQPWWCEDSLQLGKVYRTAPVDCPPDSPEFLNSVLAFHHPGDPSDLLAVTQKIEQSLGRPADHEHNAPRPIDLDIIFHGDTVLSGQALTLPHPRFAERAFVLSPLDDIIPNFVPPQHEHNIQKLAHAAGRLSPARRWPR